MDYAKLLRVGRKQSNSVCNRLIDLTILGTQQKDSDVMAAKADAH